MPELPPQFEVVVIPHSQPKTKPKACNVGLSRAVGEFCVIYDAEDRPEPGSAAQGRAGVPRRCRIGWSASRPSCSTGIRGPNWLTQCFAAEYATNFSLSLPGFDAAGWPSRSAARPITSAPTRCRASAAGIRTT